MERRYRKNQRRIALPCIENGAVNCDLLVRALDAIEIEGNEAVHLWRPWDEKDPKAGLIVDAALQSKTSIVLHRDPPPPRRNTKPGGQLFANM